MPKMFLAVVGLIDQRGKLAESFFEKKPARLKMEIIGRPPINMPMFLLSKLSLAVCWGLALVRFFQTDDVINRNFFGALVAAFFGALGAALIAVSMATLRSSLCAGLPDRKTELVTHGVYQRSRNPLYLGVFIVSAAAAVYAQNLAAYLLLAVGLVLHHRIVLSEEKFLQERFGEAWRLYSRRVRRYL